MKRLIPAGILLFSVIIAYTFSYIYITKSCNETATLINRCEEKYNQDSDAYSEAKNLSDMWDKKEKGLSFFVNHNRIDDIELEISSLLLYSKTDNQILFYEHIENLKMLLHQVKEDTRLTVHSVF